MCHQWASVSVGALQWGVNVSGYIMSASMIGTVSGCVNGVLVSVDVLMVSVDVLMGISNWVSVDVLMGNIQWVSVDVLMMSAPSEI